MKKNKTLITLVVIAICLTTIISATASEIRTQQLNAVYRDIKIVIDGEEFTPTDENGNIVEPFIANGTTYVPLRAIASAFDKDVRWIPEDSTIEINAIDVGAPQYEAPTLEYKEAPAEPSIQVTVSTPQELIDAVAPDTCITFKAGLYDLSTVTESDNQYVWAGDETAALYVCGVEGLTLQAEPGAEVELVTPKSFSEVLMFDGCNGIKLSGIKAGHSITGEYMCDAGVARFNSSMNITIEDCFFYGCGSIGITLLDCIAADITNTTVTDCSLRAIDLGRSTDIAFSKCSFVDNRAYGCAIFALYSSAEFYDCVVTGNKSLLWSLVEFDGYALFERCVFKDNALIEGEVPVFAGREISLLDCEVDSTGFGGFWDSGVADLGGNTLTP
ncbi:MAG: right-handed parallel beta-helix repeat-containing protein [Oscillospiraceae bacterium]|nr:right-handed parallel beta-helix repeat-containing protein [Oscillospiraceae bacterium]